jgi:hypothetical protein
LQSAASEKSTARRNFGGPLIFQHEDKILKVEFQAELETVWLNSKAI